MSGIMLKLSQWDVWANCPGSPVLHTSSVKHNDSAKVMQDGIAQHALAEEMIKSAGVSKYDPDGEVAPDAFNNVVDYVEVCFALVPGHIGKAEEKFDCSHVHQKLRPCVVDYIVRDGSGTLHVMDYKSGFKTVDAVGNLQLLGNILAARQPTDTNFEMHIFQPNCVDGTPAHKVWSLDSDSITQWQKYLTTKIETAKTTGQVNTGPWCKKCNGRYQCNAYLAAASQIVDVSTTMSFNGEMEPAQLEAFYGALKRSESIIKDCIASLEVTMTHRVDELPNYVLGAGRSTRMWDVDMERLRSIDPRLVQEASISPAKAEAMGIPKVIVDSLITKKSGKKKLKKTKEAKEVFK